MPPFGCEILHLTRVKRRTIVTFLGHWVAKIIIRLCKGRQNAFGAGGFYDFRNRKTGRKILNYDYVVGRWKWSKQVNRDLLPTLLWDLVWLYRFTSTLRCKSLAIQTGFYKLLYPFVEAGHVEVTAETSQKPILTRVRTHMCQTNSLVMQYNGTDNRGDFNKWARNL